MATKKQTAKSAKPPKQHEHILMPTKKQPHYLCCVRRGCHYTEYRPLVVGGRRVRVLSQYEERHGVSRRREPAIIVEAVCLWQWEETPSEASEASAQAEMAQ